ncbi:ACT domain-containing protein [Haloechinothrix salitolerans]|uniref:ACT domain-containing protein n=1 Tax=Haloechinothrix salitolerans TaxID=926830 RepID=A0ABW2C2I5_9PSEU
MKRLAIDVRPGEYSVGRLDATEPVPAGLFDVDDDALVSITRSRDEISVICLTGAPLPDGARVESGWRLLTVRGPLEFTLTGIIAALSSELASAGVPLFTLSTFDTDHLLVKQADLARAVDALRLSGHEVHTG